MCLTMGGLPGWAAGEWMAWRKCVSRSSAAVPQRDTRLYEVEVRDGFLRPFPKLWTFQIVVNFWVAAALPT